MQPHVKPVVKPLLLNGTWDGRSYTTSIGYAGDDLEPQVLRNLRSRVANGEFGLIRTVKLAKGVTFAEIRKGRRTFRPDAYGYEDLWPVSITVKHKALLFGLAQKLGHAVLESRTNGYVAFHPDNRSVFGPRPTEAAYDYLFHYATQRARFAGRTQIISSDIETAEYEASNLLLDCLIWSGRSRRGR